MFKFSAFFPFAFLVSHGNSVSVSSADVVCILDNLICIDCQCFLKRVSLLRFKFLNYAYVGITDCSRLLNPFFLVTDLHRHKIDHITILSSRGTDFGVLRRVDDVRLLNFGFNMMVF